MTAREQMVGGLYISQDPPDGDAHVQPMKVLHDRVAKLEDAGRDELIAVAKAAQRLLGTDGRACLPFPPISGPLGETICLVVRQEHREALFRALARARETKYEEAAS